jgi:molecular chaperone HscB
VFFFAYSHILVFLNFMLNHFTALNLPQGFDIDLAALERAYLAAQREYHPDRLAGKGAGERAAAIQQSMAANEAYATLKDPLRRARHLLALHGVEVGGERDTVKPEPALLMEIMELREAVAEADSAAALAALRAKTEQEKTQALAALSAAFAACGWQEAAQLAIRLGYLMKVQDDIRKAGARV